MLKTIKEALKIEKVRKKLLFMLFALIIIRIGSQIPVPGVDTESLQLTSALGFFDLLAGGALSNASIFALSVTPFITASIVIELLTIVFPRLKEMNEEGTEGRQKKAKIIKYTAVGMSLFQAVATVLVLARQGLIIDRSFIYMTAVTAGLTAGAVFLIWLSDRITEHGFGNGSSFILLVNIASRIPHILKSLYFRFMYEKPLIGAVISAVLIIAIIVGTMLLVIVLDGGERRIPITTATSGGGRRKYASAASYFPLKVNTSGVIPIIFAQTILMVPALIQAFTGSKSGVLEKIVNVCTEGNWFSLAHPLYSIGFILNILLVIYFAYYYTAILFDPDDTANTLKGNGSMINGIRPGKPTADYLKDIVNHLIFIGAVGLVIITSVPTVCNGVFNAGIAFGGTSIIIISGVIIEIVRLIEAELTMRRHTGFLTK